MLAIPLRRCTDAQSWVVDSDARQKNNKKSLLSSLGAIDLLSNLGNGRRTLKAWCKSKQYVCMFVGNPQETKHKIYTCSAEADDQPGPNAERSPDGSLQNSEHSGNPDRGRWACFLLDFPGAPREPRGPGSPVTVERQAAERLPIYFRNRKLIQHVEVHEKGGMVRGMNLRD